MGVLGPSGGLSQYLFLFTSHTDTSANWVVPGVLIWEEKKALNNKG